jgi:hypothetical protein
LSPRDRHRSGLPDAGSVAYGAPDSPRLEFGGGGPYQNR